MKEYAENRGLTFDLKGIAITKKQIIDYDLPWDPEQMSNEVQEKLENDPRYRTMLRQHGQVQAASLDTLPALHLEQFNKIVVALVTQYFDNDVYEQQLQKHKENNNEEYINNTRNILVKEFAEELGQ